MEIRSASDAATVRARSEWFTGTVWQDPLLEAPEPARVKVVRVTFEPRTVSEISCVGRAVDPVQAMARVKRSPKRMAN